MPSIEDHIARHSFKGAMITAVLTALAFVAGLFWNDAVKSAIEIIVPQRDTVGAKILAAIVVTIVVVIIGYILMRLQRVKVRLPRGK